MGKQITAEELIKALAQNGYFDMPSYDSVAFCSLVENKLSVGRNRALQILEDSGYARFEYDPNPSLNPRDSLDCWRMVLTEEGKQVVYKK